MCEKSVSCLILVLVYVSLGNTVFADDCHEHCIHCHAATCKLCRHNLYLHNGTCVHMCPSGYKETVQNVYSNDDSGREIGLECQKRLIESGNVLVALGESKYGGVPPYQVTNVIQVAIAEYCVATLSADGSVAAWGNYFEFGVNHCGGVAPANLDNVTQLYACQHAFCALHQNHIENSRVRPSQPRFVFQRLQCYSLMPLRQRCIRRQN